MRRENKVDNVRKNIIGRSSLEMLERNTMKSCSIVTIFAMLFLICPTALYPRENTSTGEQTNSNTRAEIMRVETVSTGSKHSTKTTKVAIQEQSED
jgi:hypothetical protein